MDFWIVFYKLYIFSGDYKKIGVNREEGHCWEGRLKLTKSVEKVHELDPRVRYYQQQSIGADKL
jgi:hypothetical protein